MADDEKKPDRSQQHLANQRTFLAWLRTCIVLIGLGFVIAKFTIILEEMGLMIGESKFSDSSDLISIYVAIGVISFSVFLLIYALRNYLDGYYQISTSTYTPKNSIVYLSGIGVVVFGVVIIVYLFLWFV